MTKYLFAVLAVVALLGGSACWVYGKGKDAQRAADQKTIAAKNRALSDASASLAGAATALRAVSAQAKANAEEAKRNKARAATAEANAAKDKRSYDAAQTAWERKLAEAKKQPDCRAVLEMHLCPAVSE